MSRFGWKQLIFIVPLIIVAAIFTNRQIAPTPEAPEKSAENHESDYYLRQVHITRLEGSGKVADELFSQMLTHYPHDDHSDLIAPRFKIHQADGETVWAESNDGVIYGEEKIVLTEAVNIEQRAADNNIINRIESSEIEIERAAKRITSQTQVTISGENYTIVAGAMELLSDEKKLFLNKGVEGHYAPQ